MVPARKDDPMDNDDVIDTLNELIETCKDGEQGFRECAEHTASPELRTVFEQRAQDCEKGARELQTCIVKLGGKPDEHGSATGSLHRGWVALRGKLAGHSDQAMLDECERGEDAAKSRYRKALDDGLPADVRQLVEQQYQGVLRHHEQVRALRERYAH